MRVQVKICGVNTEESVIAARDAGADAVGFVFAESPRKVKPAEAKHLMSILPPFTTRVAVFRHPTIADIQSILSVCPPDVIQSEPFDGVSYILSTGMRFLPVFHDGEDHIDDIRKYSIGNGRGGGVLLEASGRGGRGIKPRWDVATEISRFSNLVLAGGLNPENVAEAIIKVRPAAVDVSSGIESSPGVKNPARIFDFVRAVREAERIVESEVNN